MHRDAGRRLGRQQFRSCTRPEGVDGGERLGQPRQRRGRLEAEAAQPGFGRKHKHRAS